MRIERHSLIALLPLVIALAGGCEKDSSSGAAPASKPAAVAKRGPAAPITDDDCNIFGEHIIEKAQSLDPIGVAQLFDLEELVRYATTGTTAKPDLRQRFLETLERSAARGRFSAADNLIQNVAEGAALHVVRVKRDSNDRPGVILRVKFSADHVNYVHYILSRDGKGKLRIADWYEFFDGEFASDSYRRTIEVLAAEESRGFTDRFFSPRSPYMQSLPLVLEMQSYTKRGEFQNALTIYYSLPDEVQSDRSVLVQRLTAAQQVSVYEHVKALAEFKRCVNDDSRINFALFNGHMRTREYAKAEKCLLALESEVGDDAQIALMRANCFYQMNKLDEARAAARTAIEREPESVEGYLVMVKLALQAREFDVVPAMLDFISTRFQFNFGDLTQAPAFVDFVKSPQYERWLAGRSAGPVANRPDEETF